MEHAQDWDDSDTISLDFIPSPPYRHAAPCGPWPWMNIDSEPEPSTTVPAPLARPDCLHTDETCHCWIWYPECRFPNWRQAQVERSDMFNKVAGPHKSLIHYVDVYRSGNFASVQGEPIPSIEENDLWNLIPQKRPQGVRVRAMFVEDLNEPILKILGTKYKIEPFFFTSFLNWIPSRFQAGLIPDMEDHITISLTFVRAIPSPVKARMDSSTVESEDLSKEEGRVINAQDPLNLEFTEKPPVTLILDKMAVHMHRSSESSTLVSIHPTHKSEHQTSAKRLFSRIDLAGQSVYWSHIFRDSDDPTFVLLTIIWHALYAWDEALDHLWEYIMELETDVLETNNMKLTRLLHELRARLLHYLSLLDDLSKTVQFLLDTPNPAMKTSRYDDKQRELSSHHMKKECKNLSTEIARLTHSRGIQDKRLKNVMHLVFSKVNIDDSHRMQEMTKAAVQDSAAMKLIAFLTMVFLPAGFCAGVFGMNVKEINKDTNGTLAHYFATAIPFTAVTIYAIFAFQSKWYMKGDVKDEDVTIWTRLMWPFIQLGRIISGRSKEKEKEKEKEKKKEKEG